jgi:hypothetical protein
MPNRPCKPDADMKRMWQTLLPGVAMPSCGTDDADDDAKREPPEEQERARESGDRAPKTRP